MTFINENGQEVPDINDPADGNMIVGANPHTESIPPIIDNDLVRAEVKEEVQKTKKKPSTKLSTKKS